jgi:hypothetical protein
MTFITEGIGWLYGVLVSEGWKDTLKGDPYCERRPS